MNHPWIADEMAWGVGWALGQAVSPTEDAAISGFLAHLYPVTSTSPIPAPGVAAYTAVKQNVCQAANQVTPGSGNCTQNALSALQQTKSNPIYANMKVFANPATASADSVDLVVDLTGTNGAAIAAPGSPYGEITVGAVSKPVAAAAAALAARPSGTTGGLIGGAVLGGLLGAAVGGGVGGVAGAIVGGLVGNAVTKKA